MLKRAVFVFFLLAFSMPAWVQAQNVEFTKENLRNDKSLRKAAKLVKKADKYYYDVEPGYNVALGYYLDAYKVNPNSALLNYKIANCLVNMLEKFKALPYAENAYRLNPNCAYDMEYVLGQAYQQKYKFDEAIGHFNLFKESYSGKNPDTLKMADKRIAECLYGKEMVVRDDYLLVNMGDTINTIYAEYVPIVKADGSFLVFTARRPPETDYKEDKEISYLDALYSEDVFISKRVPGGWSTPERLGPPVNQPKRHNASVSLSPDGQTLYLYREDNRGDIYYSTISVDEWSKPKPMGGDVNSKFIDSHISVSYDGKTAYVVSDRPGTIGGTDIWKMDLIGENEWGNITNLGPAVNTEYDEDGVFIHPDGKTLYFSSRGHTTMGGFDIFESTMDSTGKWSKPINMGHPINSPDDDIYFVLSADGKDAYLSSVKESGYGLQDLYMIRPFEKKVIKEVKMVVFKGIVIDKETKERIPARVEIVDNTTSRKMFTANVDPLQGFLVPLPGGKNYGIAVEAEGYVFHSENFDLVYKDGFDEVEKVVEMEKVKAGAKLVLNNIFFDFDKWDLKSESQAELKRAIDLLKKYPEIKLEIDGHTDNYGTDEYNIVLSEKRANSVYEYLVSNGIDKKRIVKVTGKGESQPIATNDTDEGRAKNRRVEFTLAE
jgi:outer membrane protein OmpA-like peptidoglycan-associated protein/tetratricopeptide (TPR) repeat protein